MSELAAATAHDMAPIPLVLHCSVCELRPGCVTWRDQCAKKQCDVLGCTQPKDPTYPDDYDGHFTWCMTHGELFKNQAAHKLKVSELLARAERGGIVL